VTTHTYTLPRERPGDDPDVPAARLWAAGALGVWIQPDAVVGYFDRDDAPVPDGGSWTVEPVRDWLAAWRDGIAPVTAGPFDVVPTWLADDHPPRPGCHRIVLDPGRAFGSGHHDTTAGCLEALGDLDLAGRRVLDVGTGTGVLAIAAALAGAAPVVGVDVDPDAIEVAHANAAANGVTLDLRVGTVAAVTGTFDVVVANLLSHTILAAASELLAVLARGGTLIASGVGVERADRVRDALSVAGLDDVAVRERGEWVVLTGRRA
jgi:ribosomal protein L11 methyltransferase